MSGTPVREILRQEVRDFLRTRRARLSPADAGLEQEPGQSRQERRVPGLRREEVADLAGISVEYYIRCERGNLKGVSPEVLRALGRALQLNEVEREHLGNLARRADNPRRSPVVPPPFAVPPLQEVVDAITGCPAWIRNEQMDILAVNSSCAALYEPIFRDLPDRPNTARHCFLGAGAAEFWVDREQFSAEFAAKLRLEYARRPEDVKLKELIDELLNAPGEFAEYWASADVTSFGAGIKRFRHPRTGVLVFNYETLNLNSAPGHVLSIYLPADAQTRSLLGRLEDAEGGVDKRVSPEV